MIPGEPGRLRRVRIDRGFVESGSSTSASPGSSTCLDLSLGEMDNESGYDGGGADSSAGGSWHMCLHMLSIWPPFGRLTFPRTALGRKSSALANRCLTTS